MEDNEPSAVPRPVDSHDDFSAEEENAHIISGSIEVSGGTDEEDQETCAHASQQPHTDNTLVRKVLLFGLFVLLGLGLVVFVIQGNAGGAETPLPEPPTDPDALLSAKPADPLPSNAGQVAVEQKRSFFARLIESRARFAVVAVSVLVSLIALGAITGLLIMHFKTADATLPDAPASGQPPATQPVVPPAAAQTTEESVPLLTGWQIFWALIMAFLAACGFHFVAFRDDKGRFRILAGLAVIILAYVITSEVVWGASGHYGFLFSVCWMTLLISIMVIYNTSIVGKRFGVICQLILGALFIGLFVFSIVYKRTRPITVA